jgi:hypothetical protein
MTASLPATLPPGMTTEARQRPRDKEQIVAIHRRTGCPQLPRSVGALRVSQRQCRASLRHAGQLSNGADLDITGYWTVTVESYLGRVSKLRILEAVQEAVSP